MEAQDVSLKRYPLPPSYFKPSSLSSSLLIVYAFSLFVLPGLLARYVLSLDLPLLLAALLMAPLIWLAAQGMLLIGWLGHEGAAHFSLYPSKWLSVLTGIFVASALPTYLELGFATSHLNHHRFTNQSSDPDCQLFSPHRSLCSKLLLARLMADLQYFKNTLRIAFNRSLPYRYIYPFRGSTLITLAWINLGFSLLWLIGYGLITLYDPLIALICVGMPFMLMIAISSLQPYLEHAGTKIGIGIDGRSRTASLFTLLYAGNNYHLEHHLYPGVPCYRLPAVHRLLVEQGFYEKVNALIEPSILGAYTTAITLPYPQPGHLDSEYDPLPLQAQA